jgi:signal transduction histidine kinase
MAMTSSVDLPETVGWSGFDRRRWSAPGDAYLWRAVDVFRAFTFGYAALLYASAFHLYAHPAVGWVVIAVMGVWTATWFWVRNPSRAWIAADLVVCAGSVLATLVCDTPERIAHGEQTLPAVWSATAVFSWAVWAGWAGGAAAAAVVAAADIAEVHHGISLSTLDSIVLLFLAGCVGGLSLDLFRAGRRDLAAASAVAAATRERERLAADIHDSVLQVLAYASSRGQSLGGEAAEIARLAGQQEQRLRSLMTREAVRVDQSDERSDVGSRLAAQAAPDVVVTGPAGAVLLGTTAADALVAAVGEALDNVRRHAGPTARAWVLLDQEGDDVVVTVRDDGVGIEPGRLEAAVVQGRLGVVAAIKARLTAVGGRAVILGRPGEGTEVELRVPRARARRLP